MHHALIKESQKRLIKFQVSQVTQHFSKESRINKMHARMLRPPCIKVNGHPICSFLIVKWLFLVLRICKTKIIPAAIKESIHCICFPSSLSIAPWAFNLQESLVCKIGRAHV